MKQPNELPADKIASLEALIQQKNKERIENREKLTQNQEKIEQLQTQRRQLEAVQNELELDTAKLLTELKAIKAQSRADHCGRHPRMLAGLRVDCGGEQGHLLCVNCIRSWSSSQQLGHCPFCGKPVKNGGIDAKEMETLVEKLISDEKMLRPNTMLPLPFELEGKPHWATVHAVKPFCMLKAALINYCVPNIFYFEVHVKSGYIYIGLSDSDFPQLFDNTHVGKVPGSYSLNSWAHYHAAAQDYYYGSRLGEYAVEGDVAGCGLLVSPNNHRHRLFFTKNGRLFCQPILLPAMEAKNQILFPTVTLIHDTSIAANFGDDPGKQFCYKFGRRKISEEEKRKARKRGFQQLHDDN